MSRTFVLAVLALAACGEPQPRDALSTAPAVEPAPVARQVVDALPEPVESMTEVAMAEAPLPEITPEPTVPDPVAFTSYALRRGETLAHFARWSEVPVEQIAELSGLDLSGEYPVGTEVRVPVEGEARAAVEEAREAHREARVEGYLASRGGSLGSEFYKVRTGDTAWSIARDNQGIPVWMVEAYNPSVDLDRLRPGQELMVPIIADVVVDAD